MNILKVEEREIKTDIKPFRIMCVYVDTYYDNFPTSGYLYIPFNAVCGSILIGMTSKTDTTPISPLRYGEKCYIQNSTKNYFKRITSREETTIYINNRVWLSSLPLNNRGNYIWDMIIDPNDKVCATGLNCFPSSWFDGSYSLGYMEFTPPTNNDFGRITKGVQTGEDIAKFSIGSAKITDTGVLTQLQSIYDGSAIPDNDPYVGGGGASGGGGGTGDFDGTSDTISLPSLPSLSGLNTGFFTAFVPSASQMQSVSDYLWNNALNDILDPDTGLGEKVDALKKIVANPYDAIMGCSIIPVTPPTAGSKELKMYGLLETGISLPYASTRWVKVDCGTLNIHEFWGSYLDYSPYTKTTSLYLPYIGTVSIDIDLIMAKSLQVVYYVDILSGICVAFILVDGSVKFHYQGQCSTQVPITNADYSSVISAGIGLIGNASQVVGSAVTGGAGGGIGGAVAGAVSGAISQAPAVASNVMSAKPDIRSGGAIGSSAGILSVQRPYLIIERPKQSVPAFQNHFTGYPSNITAKVGDLTGYTEFETINLDGIPLTDAEKEELETLLKGGVYL